MQRLCEDGADSLGSSAATICAAMLQVEHLNSLTVSEGLHAREAARGVRTHSGWFLRSLALQELPGRIWEGKEYLLEALASLCKAAPTQLDSSLGKPQCCSCCCVSLLGSKVHIKQEGDGDYTML